MERMQINLDSPRMSDNLNNSFPIYQLAIHGVVSQSATGFIDFGMIPSNVSTAAISLALPIGVICVILYVFVMIAWLTGFFGL